MTSHSSSNLDPDLNPGMARLKPYPFERLREIVAAATSDPTTRLNFSIGEPKFPTPTLIHEALIGDLDGTARYPTTVGSEALRDSFVGWLERRFNIAQGALDPSVHVLPNNGSREALFAAINCLHSREPSRPRVALPNPGYQIYEGATLLAGGEPMYVASSSASQFKPQLADYSDDDWSRCQLLVVCSPSNPTGACLTEEDYAEILELADRHDLIVLSDECYADIYTDEQSPPAGLLAVSESRNRPHFARCLAFHSLSKRSNAPGLRAGFVAGDPSLIKRFYQYRTYHGSAMAPFVQSASIAAWNDDAHAFDNRQRYRENFRAFQQHFTANEPIVIPAGAFYVWLKLPTNDDLEFCRRLLNEQNVLVLPGSLMGRDVDGVNPGQGYVRIALVYDHALCAEAARRISLVLASYA